jgi:hypothetical protein
MYDFYAKPPKTKEEIREWLTSWLVPVPDAQTLNPGGEPFIQELGFRRAFYLHGVFRSLTTGEYTWWVISDEEVGCLDSFPTIRYPSYEAMLDSVVNDYFIRWSKA